MPPRGSGTGMVMRLVAVGRPRRVRWVGPPVAVGRVRRDLPLGAGCWVRWRVRGDVIDEVVIVVVDLLDNVVRRARSSGAVCSWSGTSADCLSRWKTIPGRGRTPADAEDRRRAAERAAAGQSRRRS